MMIEQEENPTTLSGRFITAANQHQGMGQGDNRWHSTRGKNLLISFLSIPEQITPDEQFNISRLVSVGLYKLLKKIIPSIHSVNIKWPNDLYVDDKKIAGILIWNRIMGPHLATSVIGCGLNINEENFPESLPGATSIFETTGVYTPVENILNAFIGVMTELNLSSIVCDGSLHEVYDQRLWGLNKERQYRDTRGIFNGIIRGTDPSGLLIIETRKEVKKYGFKEVEYL